MFFAQALEKGEIKKIALAPAMFLFPVAY